MCCVNVFCVMYVDDGGFLMKVEFYSSAENKILKVNAAVQWLFPPLF